MRVSAVRCGLVTALALMAACGSDDDSSSSSTTKTTNAPPTTEALAGDENPVVGNIDIGEGVELHLRCEGAGVPTIILEAGDESGSEEWSSVDYQLEEETRTCEYDRQGTGQSTPATAPCRQMDDFIGDLEKLVAAADLDGPFIFMGASGGGYIAAEMASRHPDDVAGIVLVETPKAITIISDEVREEISCDNPDNVEHRDYYAVEHAAWDDRQEIGDFPMVIFTNDYKGEGEGDELTNVEDQKGWLVLSPQATQVVVDSGHNVANAESDLVVEEVTKVIQATRTG